MNWPERIAPALRIIPAQALTAAAFAPFGDVIAATAPASTPINAGTAQRFDDLTRLDLNAHNGSPCVAIFRTTEQSHTAPYRLTLFERHLLGSQTFVPMGQGRCLAVLAPGDAQPDEERIQVFIVEPGQGVTLRRGVWHHPLITLGAADVLVIERSADAVDCEIVPVRGRFAVGLDGDGLHK
jgi:ureidoglycolate lyase